jgi:menaquinone-specific isochorismate synthase
LPYLKQPSDWKFFEKNQFKTLWDSAHAQMKESSLQKIVLALSDKGQSLHARALLPSFKNRRGFFYAFNIRDEVVWGFTPELFFRKNSSSLETVALAGTYSRETFQKENNLLNKNFLQRQKALDLEHSLVVEYFQSFAQKLKLSLEHSERQRLEQGNIVHLQTKIHLSGFKGDNLNNFISELHPTPALGVFPKNAESLEALHDLRRQADLPHYYGAPFGFSDSKSALFVVMIRGHFINNQTTNQILKRSIGVGVTQSSSFEEEWAELEQKRKSMELLWNL